MPNGLQGLFTDHENIQTDDVPDFLPLLFCIWDKVLPVCETISHKAPVNPVQEVEEENVRESEMDEAHCAEPVLKRGFGRATDSHRFPDEVTGNREHHNTEGVNPVVESNGQFPHIHPIIFCHVSFCHGSPSYIKLIWFTCLPSGS